MTVGVCDRLVKEICVSDKLHGGFRQKVLVHEACHSAMFSYGINISLEQEEFFCNFVANYGDEIIGIVEKLFLELKRIA